MCKYIEHSYLQLCCSWDCPFRCRQVAHGAFLACQRWSTRPCAPREEWEKLLFPRLGRMHSLSVQIHNPPSAYTCVSMGKGWQNCLVSGMYAQAMFCYGGVLGVHQLVVMLRPSLRRILRTRNSSVPVRPSTNHCWRCQY